MAALTLAVALFAAFLSVGNLVLGLYTLIRLNSPAAPTPTVNHYYQSQAQGRAFFPDSGSPSAPEDSMGMPDTYDPEDDLDAGTLSDQLGV